MDQAGIGHPREHDQADHERIKALQQGLDDRRRNGRIGEAVNGSLGIKPAQGSDRGHEELLQEDQPGNRWKGQEGIGDAQHQSSQVTSHITRYRAIEDAKKGREDRHRQAELQCIARAPDQGVIDIDPTRQHAKDRFVIGRQRPGFKDPANALEGSRFLRVIGRQNGCSDGHEHKTEHQEQAKPVGPVGEKGTCAAHVRRIPSRTRGSTMACMTSSTNIRSRIRITLYIAKPRAAAASAMPVMASTITPDTPLMS